VDGFVFDCGVLTLAVEPSRVLGWRWFASGESGSRATCALAKRAAEASARRRLKMSLQLLGEA
jgi:hypothetical protein